MSAPRVCVVIPAYDSAAWLAGTLASVAAQTFKDFEVVLVDDGSQDGTADLAGRELSRHGLRHTVVRQANRKIAAARNAGVAAAAAPLIAFLDSDDLWRPGKLSRVVGLLDARPELDVVCHAEDIVEQGRLLEVRRYGPAYPDMFDAMLFKGCLMSTSATTLRRAAFETAGGFREDPRYNTVEDYDLWIRLGRTCRFLFLDEVLGTYCYESRSSSRKIVYHHENLVALLRDHFKELYGDYPTLLQRLRMRRRLGAAYRSALGTLMTYGEDPTAQRGYALKMLGAMPADPKNAWRFACWLAGA